MDVPTLIIGSGMCAHKVARQLVMQGCSIILAEMNESQDALERRQWLQSYAAGGAAAEILTGAQLNACSGFIGNFSAEFEMRGKKTNRQASTIVIAEDSRRQTHLKDFALSAGPSIRPLSEFVNDLDNDSHAFADMQITFLNGLHRESEPVIAAEIMRCACTLQGLAGTRAHVMTGNLKVAGTGLEALYRQAKASGALFFKFTDSSPNILAGDTTDWVIEFRDEITGHQYRTTPDLIVVDETIIPSDYLAHLAGVLGLTTDMTGFLQTDNVHRLPVFTNRRGILAVGPSRAAVSEEDGATDAACAALTVLALGNPELHRTVVAADINSGQCIRCLTCYRLCPYGSIKRGKRIEVMSDACAGCGICFAECPRKAIRLGNMDAEVADHLRSFGPRQGQETDPFIVAFCCSRSAAQAHDLAKTSGQRSPAGLKIVTVPCAGAVSSGFILEAFSQGAEGVLVLTCHDDNCHSDTGNRHARRRVEHLSEVLDTIGTNSGRLAIHTTAANMEKEFGHITRDFARNVKEINKS